MIKLIDCDFCFEKNSLTGKDITWLVKQHVGFQATKLTTSKFFTLGGKYKEEKHLARIEQYEEINVSLYTEADNGPIFEVSNGAKLQRIGWKLQIQDIPSMDLLQNLTSLKGFNAAYCYDADYVYWQSENMITSYKVSKKPYEHLPKIYNTTRMEDDIDILKNPGRRTLFRGMWLLACWRMWFGEGAFRYISKECLLAFPGAEVIKELPSGAVFIELYKNPFESDSPVNQQKQQAFREWAGLNVLESQAHEIMSRDGDPDLEINEGNFPHGGIRLVTTWLDKDGKHVARSKAVTKAVRETDHDGRVVWSQRSPK